MTQPQLMRAVRACVGGLSQVARPCISSLQADEVLIKVNAFGINRPDVLQHAGVYPARPGVTDVLGLEVAGSVVGSGPGDPEISSMYLPREGEDVCALLVGGGFADFAVAKLGHCLPAAGIKDPCALPEALFTVWRNLFDVDGVHSLENKSVFIHGGSSGVGSMAIALSRAFGASLVQTTAGGAARAEQCEREFGAHKAFDHKSEPWWEAAEKADVVLDMVGGPYLEKNLGLLRSGGRLVVIGFMGGPKTPNNINLTRLLLKNLTITGSVLRSVSDSGKEKLRDEIYTHIWPRLQDGSLNLPFVAKRYKGLGSYEEAFQDLKQGQLRGGKLLVEEL